MRERRGEGEWLSQLACEQALSGGGGDGEEGRGGEKRRRGVALSVNL